MLQDYSYRSVYQSVIYQCIIHFTSLIKQGYSKITLGFKVKENVSQMKWSTVSENIRNSFSLKIMNKINNE